MNASYDSNRVSIQVLAMKPLSDDSGSLLFSTESMKWKGVVKGSVCQVINPELETIGGVLHFKMQKESLVAAAEMMWLRLKDEKVSDREIKKFLSVVECFSFPYRTVNEVVLYVVNDGNLTLLKEESAYVNCNFCSMSLIPLDLRWHTGNHILN